MILQMQLLIYKQRPDATLVASMDIWNETFGRWIAKGSKSIAVLNDDEGLDYLFDITDTWTIRQTPPPTPLANDACSLSRTG